MTLYLFLLGLASLIKGVILSRQLHGVRQKIISAHGTPDVLFKQKQFATKDDLKAMVMQYNGSDPFTEDEYDYIINALSFQPKDTVTVEECAYWLSGGENE